MRNQFALKRWSPGWPLEPEDICAEMIPVTGVLVLSHLDPLEHRLERVRLLESRFLEQREVTARALLGQLPPIERPFWTVDLDEGHSTYSENIPSTADLVKLLREQRIQLIPAEFAE